MKTNERRTQPSLSALSPWHQPLTCHHLITPTSELGVLTVDSRRRLGEALAQDLGLEEVGHHDVHLVGEEAGGGYFEDFWREVSICLLERFGCGCL